MNVLYIVLDCLRNDAVTPEITPTISKLKKENPSFEYCIAPANWSLPSHASIFTGEYPHEHHVYNYHQKIESLPLVNAFSDHGYQTFGISSNSYFNIHRNFHTHFDNFYDVRRPINPLGLDPIMSYMNKKSKQNNKKIAYLKVFEEVIKHPRPLISFKNYLQTIAQHLELDKYNNYLAGTPESEDYGSFTNASHRSISVMEDLFKKQIDNREPFFVFSNFMDCHYPYEPPTSCLNAVSDGEYDRGDILSLNPDIGFHWEFLDQYYNNNNNIDEGDLDIVRSAYYAEAYSLDEHISRIFNLLDEYELRNDTLVVITADHGEVLGESDLRGERSMGHLDSLSKHLWNVPLILINPKLSSENINFPVSLIKFTRILMEYNTEWVNDKSIKSIFDDDEPILFELPTNIRYKEWDTFDNYSHIPDWYVQRHTDINTVFGTENGWAIAAESNGRITAWRGGEKQDHDKAPQSLVSACEAAIKNFPEENLHRANPELSDRRREELEQLGYL